MIQSAYSWAKYINGWIAYMIPRVNSPVVTRSLTTMLVVNSHILLVLEPSSFFRSNAYSLFLISLDTHSLILSSDMRYLFLNSNMHYRSIYWLCAIKLKSSFMRFSKSVSLVHFECGATFFSLHLQAGGICYLGNIIGLATRMEVLRNWTELVPIGFYL